MEQLEDFGSSHHGDCWICCLDRLLILLVLEPNDFTSDPGQQNERHQLFLQRGTRHRCESYGQLYGRR